VKAEIGADQDKIGSSSQAQLIETGKSLDVL